MTRSASKRTLIPLAEAARTVYERLHGERPPAAYLEERLSGLAYWLARAGGLYAMAEGRRPRRLSREEIGGAHFRNGAQELHFLDERAPVKSLGVLPACIDRAVELLAGLTK